MEVEAADDDHDDGDGDEQGGAGHAVVDGKSADQSVQARQAAGHTW